MKVTQMEYDDMRRELADVQNKILGIDKNIKAWQVNRDDYNKAYDRACDKAIEQRKNLLLNRVYPIEFDLEHADIEKDLSVDVTQTYHPFYIVNKWNGRHGNKGYHLHPDFNWNIEEGVLNRLVLIPTKKP